MRPGPKGGQLQVGGKPGQGPKPGWFYDELRALRDSDPVIAAIRSALTNSRHPAFASVLREVNDRLEGKAVAKVELEAEVNVRFVVAAPPAMTREEWLRRFGGLEEAEVVDG